MWTWFLLFTHSTSVLHRGTEKIIMDLDIDRNGVVDTNELDQWIR